ncbi:MAG: ABC transporter ATP-binding protein [Myxococcales bacterium]|nr:ABC transporter ATP-binding protein [Myxococcales bacterium]
MSLNIERGEIVGLLGHNGAGKTTLMKMLTGYLEPSEGDIVVGGHNVVQDRLAVQRQIGYMPENAPLYPEMEVEDYLLMMANLRDLPPEKRGRAVAVAVERTGLQNHVTRPIGHLSKGFRQRVGLAQAIVHEPSLLVLDEPTNGLDPVQIQSIRELIQQLGQEATIILSTHIMQEVEAVCDRVLVMIDGRLSADSPLDSLLHSDTVLLSVKGAKDVSAALSKVQGVEAVREVGADPRHDDASTWAIDHEEGATVAPGVLELADKEGWTVLSIGPEQRTLEFVFRSLQAEHVAKQEAVA